MDITYLGHSSFKIKTKNATVVTDPFDPKNVGLKFVPIEADIVTVSHQHSDHNYLEGVKGYKKVFDGPGEYDMNDISFISIPTFHDAKKGEERGRNNVFVIEAEGIRLCHLGDLGHKLSEKDLEEIGVVNVLFVPVGGKFTIGTTEAVELVKILEPQIVIPMHYEVEGLNSEVFEGITNAELFLQEVGLTVEKMDKVTIKEIDLGETQKVVLMDPK